jgi:two-component system phosphate regulon sensor histidine kinase PhoR
MPSLRGRVFAGYAAFALLACATFLAVALPAQRAWLLERAADGLERTAALALHEMERRHPVDGAPDWQAEATALRAALGLRVTLIARDGRVIGDSDVAQARRPEVEHHGDREEVRAALDGRTGRAVRRSTTLGVEQLYVAVPARHGTLAVLRIAQPVHTFSAPNASLIALSAGAVGLSILIALLGVAWLTARQTRRVEALRGVAERVGRGDLQARAIERPGDELGRLGRAINEMAGELQTRIDALALERDEREQILTHMNDGVALIDPEGRFRHSNQRFAALIGAPAPAAVGVAFQEHARVPELRDLIELARREGRTVEVETRLWSPQRYLRATATPVGSAGRASVLLVVHDLTEIEQLNRVRQDFVANVSHELRTPLTSLRGYAETLLDGGLDDVAHREGFVRTIRDQAGRLSALVEDLLALAELESRGAGLRTERFDLHAVVARQVDAFRARAEAAGLALNLERGEPVEVTADRVRIEQAVANLLDNATKYTEQGEVRVAVETGNGSARVRVHDTGPGIPAEDLPRIFERFYRVDKARSREKGGTGLGLSIVKHVIALHGGRVVVESEPGRGSTFGFEIPAAPPV